MIQVSSLTMEHQFDQISPSFQKCSQIICITDKIFKLTNTVFMTGSEAKLSVTFAIYKNKHP